MIGGLLLGAGAVGIRLVFGQVETGVHEHTPIDVLRRRAIIQAAVAEGVGVWGMVLILLDLVT